MDTLAVQTALGHPEEFPLPGGWARETIGNLVGLVNGYAFKPSDWKHHGLPIIRIQNLNNPDALFNRYPGELPPRFRVRHGDLLFAWSGTPGTSFGAHIWRGEDAWLNQHIFKVVFDHQHLEKRFLAFAINQNLDRYISVAHGGAGLAHITKGRFESSEVLIPPLDEQRRIVAKLDELCSDLDAGIAALKRARANVKRYRAAVLKAAVEGKLTEQWREEHPDVEPASKLLERILAERRKKWEEVQLAKDTAAGKTPPNGWKDKYPASARPDFSALPQLPARWCWIGLGHIAFFQNGRSFPSSEYSTNGVNLLRPGNLFADGSVQWNDQNTKRMPDKWAENHPDYIVRGRNLIMNLTAQSLKDEFLGRVCITNLEEYCLLNQRLARITAIDGVQEMFLLYVLKSERFRRFVNELNTGSLIQHMFTSQLNGFLFPLPPFSEQSEIVQVIEERLSVTKHVEDAIDANIEHARSLRHAILKRAFEGKLVPQDPNDEPASVLLERIRAARSVAASPARNGRGKRIRAA